MSNNKQSSVDWFYKHLLLYPLPESKEELLKGDWADLYEQAKAIHKQEIARSYQEGLIDSMNHAPKDYYNETFGGNNEQQ